MYRNTLHTFSCRRQSYSEGTKYLHMYVEYRAVSGVFQNIDPHPLLHPASVSSPRTKGEGGTHSTGGGGMGSQYFGRRQTLDWPLTVYSLYG